MFICVPPVGSVYHQLKEYHIRFGLLGSAHMAVLYATVMIVGECPVPPFGSKVAVTFAGHTVFTILQLLSIPPF